VDHSKVLAAAAREVLRPAGLQQKGRSRTWLDDHGWWMAVVELQPSSWERGSYLNVGVMWLLYPQDYIAFHDGYRERAFVAAKNEASFRAEAGELCRAALVKVDSFRARLSSPAAAHDRQEEMLVEDSKRGGLRGPWDLYFAGALAFASGRPIRARELLEALDEHGAAAEWENEVKRVGRELLRSPEPLDLLARHVRTTRAALRLPDVAVSFAV
jgi:hypothetical protein